MCYTLVDIVNISCCIRGDYKHAYLNIRPVMAKSNPEWQDVETYEKYIDACGEEAKTNKTCVNWYAYYAQKP